MTEDARAVGLLTRQAQARLVPRQAVGRRLAVISLADALGSGMYYTGSALYFTLVVGLSPGQVGAGLSLGGLAGLLGAVPVGVVADRFRTGRVYIGLQVLRGVAFTAYCLVHSFPLFALVSVFAGVTESALPPVGQAVVGATVPGEDRVDTLAKIRAVRNAGFGLGALAATAAIGQGSAPAFRSLVAINAASYFVVALLLARIGVGKVAARPDPSRRTRLVFVPDRRYLSITALQGVLAVHSTLLVVAAPLWFVRHTSVPRPLIGVMVALNTVIAVLWQARFAKPCATVAGAVRASLWAGGALAVFALACQGAHEVRWTAVAITLAFMAVVALTFGELWQSASGWTLSYELADADRRTAYLATFQLGNALQQAAAPWLITTVLFPSPFGWLAFGAVAVAAGALIGPVTRQATRSSPGA
jgi:MFS family permease